MPAPIEPTTIEVPLSSAVVFKQAYSEYTNAGNHYTESVAILTLKRPRDPKFPILVLRADRGELNHETFVRVVQQLGSG